MKEVHGIVAYFALRNQLALFAFIDYGSDDAASSLKASEAVWSRILVSLHE